MGDHDDISFKTMIYQFKRHEMGYTLGKRPSEVDHCEMIQLFIKEWSRSGENNDGDKREILLNMIIAYLDEQLISMK